MYFGLFVVVNLPTFVRPTSYEFKWLTSYGSISIQMQVKVEFPIEDYTDVVLCDVLHLEACHLLLARPWQYDHNAIHDGYSNQIYFNHNGRRVTLFPMSPQECLQDHTERKQRRRIRAEEKKKLITKMGPNLHPKKNNAPTDTQSPKHLLLARVDEVLSALKGSNPCYLLLFKESCAVLESLQDLPPNIVSILQEFRDVFPGDILTDLLPLRGIKHQIHFITGATIPKVININEPMGSPIPIFLPFISLPHHLIIPYSYFKITLKYP